MQNDAGGPRAQHPSEHASRVGHPKQHARVPRRDILMIGVQPRVAERVKTLASHHAQYRGLHAVYVRQLR